jgi:hypothetical protein
MHSGQFLPDATGSFMAMKIAERYLAMIKCLAITIDAPAIFTISLYQSR